MDASRRASSDLVLPFPRLQLSFHNIISIIFFARENQSQQDSTKIVSLGLKAPQSVPFIMPAIDSMDDWFIDCYCNYME